MATPIFIHFTLSLYKNNHPVAHQAMKMQRPIHEEEGEVVDEVEEHTIRPNLTRNLTLNVPMQNSIKKKLRKSYCLH